MPESKRDSAQAAPTYVKVRYLGPHGKVIHGRHTLVVNGDPVSMGIHEYEDLQRLLPDHRFEVVED